MSEKEREALHKVIEVLQSVVAWSNELGYHNQMPLLYKLNEAVTPWENNDKEE